MLVFGFEAEVVRSVYNVIFDIIGNRNFYGRNIYTFEVKAGKRASVLTTYIVKTHMHKALHI